jgi:hypothetical protein
MLHAGYRASFDLERAAGAVSNKDATGHSVDTWTISYTDVDSIEPLVRSGCKQGEAQKTGEPHQARVLSGYKGRTWCFDMSSAPSANDGFVVVRRAVRELKTDYDARVHGQGENVLPDVALKVAKSAKWVVTHASVPTIQGSYARCEVCVADNVVGV